MYKVKGVNYHFFFVHSLPLSSSLFPPLPPSLPLSQDHLQLSHSQVLLNTDPKPEQYQNIIIILLAIAKLHPHNLSLLTTNITQTLNNALGKSCDQSKESEGDGCGLWKDIVKQLNELFWLYYHRRPVNPVTCSILSMGE